VRRLIVAAALAASLLGAAPAAALGPEALAGDPLDRAAALALPAIYRLESSVAFEGLVDADGTPVPVPDRALTVHEVGTAFGAGQGGHVVAAGHVALPGPENLAVAALLVRDAEEGVERTARQVRRWVRDRGVRPVGTRRMRLIAEQAGGGHRYPATLVRVDRRSDLALVRLLGARAAPVLSTVASASLDTPVVTIGFGTGVAFTTAQADDAPTPVVRKGRLGRSVQVPDVLPGQTLTRVDTLVREGDSGGPAVDVDGHVRGVVLLEGEEDVGGGLLMRSAEVDQLLKESGVSADAGPADTHYRTGLNHLWALDFPAARESFTAAEKAFPQHTLAGALAERATDLERAEFRVAGRRRPQAFLLALGIVSAIAALTCALALAAPALARAFTPER
jgi:hypothetical protein